MARKKHIKIKQVLKLPNVFSIKDNNLSENIRKYFGSNDKYTLELGCGHGDYSVKLAEMYPNELFIGLDIKAARIFNGAKRAVELRLKNAAFLISRAENIIEIFPENSIEEIYIPFPDPHIKRKSEPRRLVSKKFLEIYKTLLVKDGKVHLKTDNTMFFEYTLKITKEFECKILSVTENIYTQKSDSIADGIITNYEQHFLKEGRIIKYICFQF